MVFVGSRVFGHFSVVSVAWSRHCPKYAWVCSKKVRRDFRVVLAVEIELG
jgi:hypothetical protein